MRTIRRWYWNLRLLFLHPRYFIHKWRCQWAGRDLPRTRGKFCDYCLCVDCRDGKSYLTSIACTDGTHICDVCYVLDPCCTARCSEQPCCHKPAIRAVQVVLP